MIAEQRIERPERNLLLAVLRRAMFDYFGNASGEREAAARWFFEGMDEELDDAMPRPAVSGLGVPRPRGVTDENAKGVAVSNSDSVFSFKWVCHHLGFEPSAVLAHILAIEPRGGMRTQQWWSQLERA